MTALCLSASGKKAVLLLEAFRLIWTHSVEKIEWAEDWRIDGAGLTIESATIKGSGAGMEPPPDAVPIPGGWRYVPGIRRVEKILLARSEFTPDHKLCHDGKCLFLNEIIPYGPTEIRPCPPETIR